MNIAVVGAGITGACIAWELAQSGWQVTLYEQGEAMRQTSSSSSKLLHGGLRYLEHGQFRLVREALQERQAWFRDAPQWAKPLLITLPIYRQSRRGQWLMGLGLTLYDALAMGSGLPRHQWLNRQQAMANDPDLRAEGLIGAYQFWDGQMDDYRLGLWVLGQAAECGARLLENTPVQTVSPNGQIRRSGGATSHYDRVILAAGPWNEAILARSQIASRYRLDRVRGSHIVLDRPTASAYLLEVPGEKRIVFILPWHGQTLVGTTEERQESLESPQASRQEIEYLLNAYNTYRTQPASAQDISQSFAGNRPLIKSTDNPSAASREYALEQTGQLMTIWGGKWTTSRALARKVKTQLENT